MNSPMIQLLVLAAIAVFLILRLKNVLGTRTGFEKPAEVSEKPERPSGPAFEVIEGGPDLDITDHAPEGSDTALALAEMKRVEPSFGVSDFLGGARGAYEMILMAFERGEVESLRDFLSQDVYDSFAEVVEQRRQQGRDAQRCNEHQPVHHSQQRRRAGTKEVPYRVCAFSRR